MKNLYKIVFFICNKFSSESIVLSYLFIKKLDIYTTMNSHQDWQEILKKDRLLKHIFDRAH